ncbi:disease resistance protein At4g27190-like [Rutidosis leptorrhynchoides]|uniref:disease resistance protein At4g27190-like n=1 Tax=Rutidosis leptorrhynchoides TaxID=125765 RepID=UPI003A9A2D03
MDVVIGCAGNLIAKIGETLFVETSRHLGYVLYCKNYLKSLKEQVEKLKAKSDGIMIEVEDARRNGEIVAPEVDQWFAYVDIVCEESMKFLEIEVQEKKTSWFPNLKRRYILGKTAKKKIEKAAWLKVETFHKISYPAPPLEVGEISNKNFRNFESRIPTANQLMEWLKDDTKRIISICGMGGSGKTTLVKEVARRVKGEKLFDDIVMAVVSKEHDLKNVQEDLAKWLGLRFKSTTLEGRANELWKRLLKSKKGNLVILDDVWTHVDLKSIGIPLGKEYNNCKVILTSRSVEVCKATGCNEIIHLDVLTQSEALTLFEEMVGDSLQNYPERCEIASEITKKCGGLPIAIVGVGRALKDKRKEAWNYMLQKLQQAIVPENTEGMKEEIYKSIQVSYDLLEDEEAKKIFILCCLYPEYANVSLEALARNGFGLDLFRGVDLLMQARDRVHAITDQLKSRFLLLSGDRKSTVKVHNVVRAVGISIATTSSSKLNMKQQFSAVVIHEDKWPRLIRTSVDFNAISLVSNEISEIPSRWLNFDKVELFQLSCPKLVPLMKLDPVFEEMKKLRVVEMWNMSVSSLSSLIVSLPRHIYALCMDCKMETIGDIKSEEFVDLEILSLGNCDIQELPLQVGKFVNLRLLDLSRCHSLQRIAPGVISSLSQLEELDTGPKWWGDEENDASITELESLTYLIYLGIRIKSSSFLPKRSIFQKLQRYVISVGVHLEKIPSFNNRMLLLRLESTDTHLGGGIEKLLRKNADQKVFLTGDGIKIVLKELVSNGFQQVRNLTVECCNSQETEYLSDYNYSSDSSGVFNNLEKLRIEKIRHLKGILRDEVQGLPVASFSRLRKIRLSVIPEMTHLFTQSVATNLVQLESINIQFCHMMEQVISIQRSSITTEKERIAFLKLKEVILFELNRLTFFCRGIHHVEFPQLRVLRLRRLKDLRTFSCEEAASRPGPVFDDKVSFPSLETLVVSELDSIVELWPNQLAPTQFGKLKSLRIEKCHKLVKIFPSDLDTLFPKLEKLEVEKCDSLEQVWGSKRVQIRNLKSVYIYECPKLKNLCYIYTFKGLLNLQILDLSSCKMMEGVVFDDDRDENLDAVVSAVNKLEQLTLANLPNLNYFSNTKCYIGLPELNQVTVKSCPDICTFSEGSVVTQRLKFALIDGEETWKGDLNSTIQHRFSIKKTRYLEWILGYMKR